MAAIGLDLGGTKLSGAVFDTSGELLTRETKLLESRKGKAVGKLIRIMIKELYDVSPGKGSSITALGVSVPGISHVHEGTVWAPNIGGWENYPLHNEITSMLDDPGITITIDSDRACSILGEVWKGAAVGCKNAVFLAVGTGIGAGIYTDGKVMRGEKDIAGAIGWLTLNKPYHPKYRQMGCFEYHASGDGLARMALEYLKEEKDYSGILKDKKPDEISAHHLFLAYEQDDDLAKRVMKQAIEFWGMAIANLVSLFNPEKIILGGGVFGPALQFKQQIIEEATRWAQPISIQRVAIEGSVLQNDAPLYGAAYLALNDTIV